MFESNLDSSFKNIYKVLKNVIVAISVEQMWEFRLRWKSPGIYLKPPNAYSHTYTQFIFIVWNPPDHNLLTTIKL